MRVPAATVAVCVVLTACGAFAPADTARMPNNPSGGPAMTQSDAISYASYALMNPDYTHGHPDRGAQAVIAEDWLAGQSQLTPDFGLYGPANEWEWGELRRAVRKAIGVSPETPSQVLLDRLQAVEVALRDGKTEEARRLLQPPVFSLGPDATLAALGDLPRFANITYAFSELRRNEFRSTSPCPATNC